MTLKLRIDSIFKNFWHNVKNADRLIIADISLCVLSEEWFDFSNLKIIWCNPWGNGKINDMSKGPFKTEATSFKNLAGMLSSPALFEGFKPRSFFSRIQKVAFDKNL